ncbi:MAG TPA: alpha-ketoglutarate-dependent dioxygenase AlkB [Myxococcales bacterium]|jgi:alkylated DNA repair dioxygenase AlkB
MQAELFAAPKHDGDPSFDRSFGGIERIQLDPRSWVDYQREWVRGSQPLFEHIRDTRPWKQRTRKLFDKEMLEPRLTAPWSKAGGRPLDPPILEELRQALSQRYGVELDTVGFNYYRDGRDSVAWHRDHIRREIREPIVALLSLGEPRKLLMRPHGGGSSLPFTMGPGDLLVTGGLAQREWEHTIAKVARAGPRISLAFRHGLRLQAY